MSLRIALIALLAMSLTSCGGSGGGGAGANDGLFVDEFFVCAIQGLIDTAIDVDANFGTGTADGSGTFEGMTMQNDDGIVTGPFDFGLGYTVDENRILIYQGGVWQGSLTSDGSVGALSTIAEGSIPQLQLVLKKSGTLSASNLTGAYRFGYWRRDGGQDICSMGTMTFDGVADWTSTIDFTNTNGAAVNGGTDSGTYTVAPDGTVDVTFDTTTDTLRGGLKENGEAAFLGGTIAIGFPAKLVLLRNATAASNATFDGAYYVAGFGRVNTGGYESIVGLMVANGAGGIEFSFTANSNGGIVPTGQTSGTSGVAGDGTLSVSFGPQLLGGIAASGEMGFLAGGTNASSSPLLLFLIRQ